ncbi:class II aldolase/adducin family protein [Ghiorsea bivora]|uniref:class II aldolase/adducin family protein n=1 Tax=Ghiorsea bivora TaxID=1485545 RepID=UPI000689D359|nr:class II aldolase/adducin family protein [Ghiorsea bivora]
MIDGVIKYHVSHTQIPSPEFTAFHDLEALRCRLFALGLIGETPDGIGYGNISFRNNGERSFTITATQTGKQPHLKPNAYIHIVNYDFGTFTVFSEGEFKPSSEALSHAMIYEIHPDIQAVIHVHSAALWQMMIKQKILATTAEYGTAEMVREIAALYQSRNPFKYNAFVMKGHKDGIITFGKNIKEAELRLYHLIQETLNQI